MRARVLFMLATLPVLACSEIRAEDSCSICHPNVKTEYAESIHAKELGCPACHGGDPALVDLESHSVAAGYIGKPGRADIPAVCARCHADPKRMKPFGLSTDQYAQYQTSEHGVRLAQGDTRTAVCTDCHGTHRIVPTREPTSPTARHNIPTTCGRCHNDRALMAPYGLPTDQVEEYRRGVHGVALFDAEHPSSPTCATCHGAHGAIAPHVGSISMVCGHCHSRTREYFREGPHRRAADEGKMSECVSCHGYHEITPPDRTLFDICEGCHAAGSPSFATAQKLKTLLSRAEETLETCTAEMSRVATLFPTVAHYYPRLQQAKANFMEALPVQHSLAVDRVDDLTRSARSIAEDVRASVHGVEQEGQLRYVVLGLAWVFILFTVGVAYLYKRERARTGAQREEEAERE